MGGRGDLRAPPSNWLPPFTAKRARTGMGSLTEKKKKKRVEGNERNMWLMEIAGLHTKAFYIEKVR